MDARPHRAAVALKTPAGSWRLALRVVAGGGSHLAMACSRSSGPRHLPSVIDRLAMERPDRDGRQVPSVATVRTFPTLRATRPERATVRREPAKGGPALVVRQPVPR